MAGPDGGANLGERWRETLIFELGGRRFGVPAEEVQELVRMVAITPLMPGSEGWEGVIDFRGTIVPVFDLRARLGLPARAADPSESLAIVRRGPSMVAIRVDRPLELAAMPVEDGDGPGEGQGSGSGWPGVAQRPEGLAILLDLGAMVGPPGEARGAAS